MKFIETLKEGERLNDIYLCKFKQALVTKSGKPYESIILQDKTGTVDAKIWEPNSSGIEDFDVLDYIEVFGEVTSFQGALQVNVKRIRFAREGEYNPADYLPTSKRNIEEMYGQLLDYAGQVKNPYLHQLLESFFVKDQDFARRFQTHSAAKTVHHGFIGGLLEHTLGVARLCAFYADTYPVLNKDLLMTAAMFHDIGKLWELSDFPLNDYTDEGQLLGHIMIGTEEIGAHIREIPGFPQKLSNELKHCILAHHGEYEYGSPKKPALVEAMALNFADNMDAKMQTMTELFAAAGDNQAWLGFNRILDTNVRRTGTQTED